MLNYIGFGLIALFLIAVTVEVVRRRYFYSTPLSPKHPGKRHDHSHDDRFSCKFDAEEVRRTAGQKRPRIEAPNAPADPRVAAILAAIEAKDMMKVIRDLSGEQAFVLNGKTVQIKSRNTYHKDLDLALGYVEQFYAGLGVKSVRHNYKVRGRALCNIIVEFRGSKNPEKVLILGAHLDATAGNPWSTENATRGADDDGSGTSAMFELAKILVKMNPGITVRICHFTGEEQGLYGSYAYSDVVSKETNITVVGMIETDMIAYCNRPGNRVDVHDDADRNGSHSLVVTLSQNAARYGLKLNVVDTHNHAVQDRSDHAGFIDHGYKAVLVSEEFTDEGFNPNYHTMGDASDAVNQPYMVEVVRMVAAAVIELAECK